MNDYVYHPMNDFAHFTVNDPHSPPSVKERVQTRPMIPG